MKEYRAVSRRDPGLAFPWTPFESITEAEDMRIKLARRWKTLAPLDLEEREIDDEKETR